VAAGLSTTATPTLAQRVIGIETGDQNGTAGAYCSPTNLLC